MTDKPDLIGVHEASASALGFYYQTHFALLSLISLRSDDAAVAVERLDDVELQVNGHNLLYQLKHSISPKPPAITLSCVALWKTIKVWIDILPSLSLAETTFHLVAVGAISPSSPLLALCDQQSDRADLLKALKQEAERVMSERAAATIASTKLPHADRASGCKAFLELGELGCRSLIRRIQINPSSPDITKIEELVADELHVLPIAHRQPVAERLIEWWGRQVVYSLCDKRDRAISASELKHQISLFNSAIEEEQLLPDFQSAVHPADYQPHSMLGRQISLVDGSSTDLSKAIREQWRAQQQRSKWVKGNPGMKSRINEYDVRLTEHWADLHEQLVEDCHEEEDGVKRKKGLDLLRWTHKDAPNYVEPIAQGWSGHYYVRGSYQVLAVDLQVGWHPDYRTLLQE